MPRPKVENKKVIHSIRVEPNVLKKLKAYAQLEETSTGVIVEKALMQYAPLKKHLRDTFK